MGSEKNDASTDVDTLARKLADTMTDIGNELQDERRDAIKTGKHKVSEKEAKYPVAVVKFSVISKGMGAFRTPAMQAKAIADNKSWTIWGAHMADKARDVHLETKPDLRTDVLEFVFWDKFKEFRNAWVSERNALGLRSANKGDDKWYEKDPLHVEQEDARIDPNDKRAQACLEEYVKLTRNPKKETKDYKNRSFEKEYRKQIEQVVKRLKLGDD